jgi:hemolysin activation/secretion protein
MKAMFRRAGLWPAILACLVVVPVVHAASVVEDPALLDQFRLEQQKRQSQVEEALKRPRSKVPAAPKEKKPVSLLAEGECRQLNRIWLYGADHLPGNIKRDINKTYLHSCITNTDIENILKVLQDWYLNSGYITTRVVLKPNQSSFDVGNLEIYVREGYIDRVTLDKDTDFDQRRVDFALPGIKDQILNIKQLDQGIEILNRGFASSVKMQVKPSEIPAHSTIVLSEHRNASTAFTEGLGRNLGRQKIAFTMNNSGSESTGEFLNTTTLERDNLFGVNDNIQLSWTESSPSVENEKQNLNQSARFTMPYGKWDFTLSKYNGYNIRTIDGKTTTFSSSGDSISYNIEAKRLLFRDNSRKVEAKLTAKHSNKKNYINETLVEISSRRMSSLDLGMNFNWFTSTTTFILSPSVSGGMPWFDSITDPADIQASDPHAEYSIYKLYATVYKQIASRSRFPMTWSISLNGQATQDVQYSENQFVLGGEYSVRGYKNNVLAGDVGWSMRSDFTLPLGKWFSGKEPPRPLYPINFKLFYDYGEVKTLSDLKSDRLEGYGWGLEYQYRWFSLNYSQALALRQSNQFAGPEGWVQYYSAGFNFTI